MNWYQGNISEAVALSKHKSAIFVVYVEGKDEAAIKLSNFINDTRIRQKLESDDFVAIKIEGEGEAYMHFASIFQIVPVPSIFFIGKAGTPLDIVTGVLSDVEELEKKIEKVLILAGKQPVNSSTAINSFIQEESKASTGGAAAVEIHDTKNENNKEKSNNTTTEIVCENGVCYKQQKDDDTETQAQANQATEDKDAKLAETRKYLEQKRRERVEEEKRLEKELELRRRKEGKEMQNLRAMQKDQELKELKENIKREKLEEQAARERIRAQIAADKAERLHKFSTDGPGSSYETENKPSTSKTTNAPTLQASNESRIQFRLASGACNYHNFKCSTTLTEIRNYVSLELLQDTGITEFTLATTYPKRELTPEHDTKTLTELELFPSAVILIIGKEATGPTAIISRNGGLINMMFVWIQVILNPIFSLFTSAKNWLVGTQNGSGHVQTGAQKRGNEDKNQQNISKRRNLDRFAASGTGNTTGTSKEDQADSSAGSSQGGSYRRFTSGTNIHRLSDNRKDSDDENATWNGNSTQQQ